MKQKSGGMLGIVSFYKEVTPGSDVAQPKNSERYCQETRWWLTSIPLQAPCKSFRLQQLFENIVQGDAEVGSLTASCTSPLGNSLLCFVPRPGFLLFRHHPPFCKWVPLDWLVVCNLHNYIVYSLGCLTVFWSHNSKCNYFFYFCNPFLYLFKLSIFIAIQAFLSQDSTVKAAYLELAILVFFLFLLWGGTNWKKTHCLGCVWQSGELNLRINSIEMIALSQSYP